MRRVAEISGALMLTGLRIGIASGTLNEAVVEQSLSSVTVFGVFTLIRLPYGLIVAWAGR